MDRPASAFLVTTLLVMTAANSAAADSGDFFFFELRPQIGGAVAFDGARSGGGVAFDVQTGVGYGRIPRGDQTTWWGLAFDAGYSYAQAINPAGHHSFTLGGAGVFGLPEFAIGPCAWLVVGQLDNRPAAGVRIGARMVFLYLIDLEITYESRWGDTGQESAIRFGIGTQVLGALFTLLTGWTRGSERHEPAQPDSL